MDEIDPADGLPVGEVGDWTLEKHARLRRYIDAARAARRKFLESPDGGFKGGATYIDFFCGPGRAKMRGTSTIIDGSPLVAFKAASAGVAPFSEIHLADIDKDFVPAAVHRIETAGGKAFGYIGPAKLTVHQITGRLNRHGLHFAFMDPFNLDGLAFSVIEALAKFRIDLLLHVSVSDLQRNIDLYSSQDQSPLDSFAPGRRTVVNLRQSQAAVRADLMKYWSDSMLGLGFTHRGVELVTGSRNQRLYWLVFLSKSEFANDLWDKIRNVSGQGDLLSDL